jgi:DNA-binding CsgD family transcriptional regulator
VPPANCRLGKSTLAAKEMGITYQTAKNYLESVRIKLGACNTVQAVYIALNKGVIE